MGPSLHSAFLICSTPRSGSYLLGEAMESAGIGGKTVEYFDRAHEAHIRAMVHAERAGYRAMLASIIAFGTSPKGVFGAKAHWFQLDSFAGRLAAEGALAKAEGFAAILSALPNLKCIWLRRSDRIRQAISYARAAQTNVWWKIDGAPPPPPPIAEETFDFKSITDRLRNIDDSEFGWQGFFAQYQIAPLVVWYEDLVANYSPTIAAVAAFLGIAADAIAPLPPPRLQQQADATTDRWARQYQDWLSDPSRLEK